MTTRAEDAARFRQAVNANPADRVAWHNLASAEGDIGRAAASEAAARQAITLGIKAPETRLVLGRALQHLRRYEEAERAFTEAIALRPHYAEAHRDLAQLIWMRTAEALTRPGPVGVAVEAGVAQPALGAEAVHVGSAVGTVAGAQGFRAVALAKHAVVLARHAAGYEGTVRHGNASWKRSKPVGVASGGRVLG